MSESLSSLQVENGFVVGADFEASMANVPVFSETYDVDPSLVKSVRIDASGPNADPHFPLRAMVFGAQPTRRFALELANPDELPFAQAKLGGATGMEIPRLDTFLRNVATLDQTATEAVSTEKEPVRLLPSVTLRYRDESNENRLLFLYQQAGKQTGSLREAIAPVIHDVSAEALLSTALQPQPLALQTPERNTLGQPIPDEYSWLRFGDKTLRIGLERSLGYTYMEHFQVFPTPRTDEAPGEGLLWLAISGSQAEILSQGWGTITWQQQFRSGCGSHMDQNWY